MYQALARAITPNGATIWTRVGAPCATETDAWQSAATYAHEMWPDDMARRVRFFANVTVREV